jgi:HTH-type transcriptional regulator / antitoxin HipB
MQPGRLTLDRLLLILAALNLGLVMRLRENTIELAEW